MRPVPQKIGTAYGVPGHMWQAGHHTGVDFLAPTGTPVQAAIPGVVVHAGTGGWGAAYGNHVVVQGDIDGTTVQVLYAHLSRVAVKAGQVLKAGAVLGRSGATGNVTGPHLHLEVRRSPFRYGTDVDPAAVLAWQAATHVSNAQELLDQALAELDKANPKRWRVKAARKALQTARKSLPTR